MMDPRAIVASWYAGDRVLIYGHRGASAYAPMNTIPAFELAVEQGADAIELDVHLTHDGHLIIVHDFTVDHTTDSTGTVTEKTLNELKALDAGSWFDERFAGTRLPTLTEVFEAVGQRLYINVEIKSLSVEDDSTEEAVIACIKQQQMGERVIISSFNPHVLKRTRTLAPEIALGYLLAPSTLNEASHTIITPQDYEALHLYHGMVDAQQIAFAREHDLIVNCWTVNEAEVAQSLVAQGVRGIMSDYPDVMKQTLT
ncbi:MAG: glycerophosphodiester phosphodiesterase [Anaerolineae bacterium]